MMEMTVTLGDVIGGLGVAILGALLVRRNTRIESEIRSLFDERLKVFESQRSWKEQALFELFGPAEIQFERTKRAFSRWNRRNLHLEAEVVRTGNMTIRDLLLTKGHLIPPDLMKDAGLLIEHYDAWLEIFESIRNDPEKSQSTDFAFAGPAGYPFPIEAEQNFRRQFKALQHELYGV